MGNILSGLLHYFELWRCYPVVQWIVQFSLVFPQLKYNMCCILTKLYFLYSYCHWLCRVAVAYMHIHSVFKLYSVVILKTFNKRGKGTGSTNVHYNRIQCPQKLYCWLFSHFSVPTIQTVKVSTLFKSAMGFYVYFIPKKTFFFFYLNVLVDMW